MNHSIDRTTLSKHPSQNYFKKLELRSDLERGGAIKALKKMRDNWDTIQQESTTLALNVGITVSFTEERRKEFWKLFIYYFLDRILCRRSSYALIAAFKFLSAVIEQCPCSAIFVLQDWGKRSQA